MASICNGPKARYCRSACCYIKNKPVHTSEVEDLGLENIVEKRGGLYLKNKDNKIFCSFSSYTEYRKFLKHLNKVKVTWKFDGFFREETAEKYVGKV